MKKFLILICIMCIIIISLPSFSIGAEYIAGVRAGYFAWQPFLKDIGASGMSDITWGTGILYGPLFSIIFTDDLSVSVSTLFGKQSTHWQSEMSYFDPSTRVTGNYQFEAFRVDVDPAISYRISQYFKLFAGYKYQYLKLAYKYTEIRTDSTNQITEVDISTSDPSKNQSHGPALGIGFTYPISEVYFFSMNFSGLYMTTDWELTWKGYKSNPPPLLNLSPQNKASFTFRQIGVNVEPVIGMDPGNNLPIITLGFRFQRTRLEIVEPKIVRSDKRFDDTIIGGFVSVVFMF